MGFKDFTSVLVAVINSLGAWQRTTMLELPLVVECRFAGGRCGSPWARGSGSGEAYGSEIAEPQV